MASFIKIPPELKSVLSQFSENADENILSPLAAKLGISPSALCGIVKILPVVTDENFDLQSALPKILPVVLNYVITGGDKPEKTSDTPLEKLSEKDDRYTVTLNDSKGGWDTLIQSDLY